MKPTIYIISGGAGASGEQVVHTTLAQFAETARDEVDMEKLTAALLGVVEKTVQPEQLSIWINPMTKHHRPFDGKNSL